MGLNARFQNLKFEQTRIDVNNKPYEKECKVFALPALKYGKDAILNPYEGEVKYGQPIDHFAKRRREFIYNNGILSETPFCPQYIFAPDNMDFELVQSTKYHFDKLMKQIAPQFPGFIIHQYSMKNSPFAHKVFSDLKIYIQEKNLSGGNGIFILDPISLD